MPSSQVPNDDERTGGPERPFTLLELHTWRNVKLVQNLVCRLLSAVQDEQEQASRHDFVRSLLAPEKVAGDQWVTAFAIAQATLDTNSDSSKGMVARALECAAACGAWEAVLRGVTSGTHRDAALSVPALLATRDWVTWSRLAPIAAAYATRAEAADAGRLSRIRACGDQTAAWVTCLALLCGQLATSVSPSLSRGADLPLGISMAHAFARDGKDDKARLVLEAQRHCRPASPEIEKIIAGCCFSPTTIEDLPAGAIDCRTLDRYLHRMGDWRSAVSLWHMAYTSGRASLFEWRPVNSVLLQARKSSASWHLCVQVMARARAVQGARLPYPASVALTASQCLARLDTPHTAARLNDFALPDNGFDRAAYEKLRGTPSTVVPRLDHLFAVSTSVTPRSAPSVSWLSVLRSFAADRSLGVACQPHVALRAAACLATVPTGVQARLTDQSGQLNADALIRWLQSQ